MDGIQTSTDGKNSEFRTDFTTEKSLYKGLVRPVSYEMKKQEVPRIDKDFKNYKQNEVILHSRDVHVWEIEGTDLV